MVMSATKQDQAKQRILSKEDTKTLLIHYTTPSNRLDDYWETEKRRLTVACKYYRLEIPDWLTSN